MYPEGIYKNNEKGELFMKNLVKKALCAALSTAMILSLTACGTADSSQADTKESEAVKEEVKESETVQEEVG